MLKIIAYCLLRVKIIVFECSELLACTFNVKKQTGSSEKNMILGMLAGLVIALLTTFSLPVYHTLYKCKISISPGGPISPCGPGNPGPGRPGSPLKPRSPGCP